MITIPIITINDDAGISLTEPQGWFVSHDGFSMVKIIRHRETNAELVICCSWVVSRPCMQSDESVHVTLLVPLKRMITQEVFVGKVTDGAYERVVNAGVKNVIEAFNTWNL
jgi:hypothetical protein